MVVPWWVVPWHHFILYLILYTLYREQLKLKCISLTTSCPNHNQAYTNANLMVLFIYKKRRNRTEPHSKKMDSLYKDTARHECDGIVLGGVIS